MTIAQVGNWTSAQFNNNTGGSLGGRTSTAGNHVVIGCSTSDAATHTITHSQAGTVQTGRPFETAASGDTYGTLYIEDIVGGASHTISVATGANQFTALHATEYSGVAPSGSLDQTANGTGTDTTNTFDLASSAVAAVSQNAELVVGVGGIATNSAGGTWSGQGGYTLRGSTTAGNVGSVSCLVDQIIAAGGTPAAQARLTDAGGLAGGNGSWLIQTVTFKGRPAAPTLVQAVRGQLNNAASVAVTIAATGAGNTIVVAISAFNNTVAASQVTDNKGGGSSTYVLPTGGEQHASTAAVTGIVYVANCAAGITQVTYNPGAGAGQFGTIVVYELGNVAAASVDKAVSGSGTGTAVASGSSGTLTQADEIGIGVCSTNFGGGGNQAVTETAPWVLDFEDETSNITQNSEIHQIVAATTALNAQWTLGASQTWGATLVTFMGAAPAATPIVTTSVVRERAPLSLMLGRDRFATRDKGRGQPSQFRMYPGATLPVVAVGPTVASTGGLALDGQAAAYKEVTVAASGRLIIGGKTTAAKTATAAAQGSLSLAGRDTASKSVTEPVTGSLTLGGRAAPTKTGQGVTRGVLALNGRTNATKTGQGTSRGVLAFLGTAVGAKTSGATQTRGSLTLAGRDTPSKTSGDVQVRGSLLLAGRAVLTKAVAAATVGLLSLTGRGNAAKTTAGAARGTLAFDGQGNASKTTSVRVTAALLLSGRAFAGQTADKFARGVLVLTGRASATKSFDAAVRGNLVGGGRTSGAKTATVATRGSMVIGARDAPTKRATGTATGSLTLRGVATFSFKTALGRVRGLLGLAGRAQRAPSAVPTDDVHVTYIEPGPLVYTEASYLVYVEP